jgi:hypothetical protein
MQSHMMPVEPVTDVEPFTTLMRGIFELEITDAKTMLGHHKFIWSLLNTSPHQTNPGIEFDASSVIPRTAEQLNLAATGDDIQAQNIKLLVDQPNLKAFFIPYLTPQMTSERRNVVIEYDWEEPDRRYGYNFAQRYEDFICRLIFPKDLQVNPAINKVRESGEPIRDTLQRDQQFVSSIVGDKLVLEWHSINIPPLTVYRFDW